jgi:ornithine decarboxylase
MNLVSIAPKSAQLDYQNLVAEHGSPLMVLDCEVLRQRYRELCRALPGVRMFYAIKSLSALPVLETLQAEGSGFDVATTGEIRLLEKIGADPAETIHTHPIKRDQDIRDALAFGCNTFVADNIDELKKFLPFAGQARILLRVSFRSKDATIDLSRKFGCSPERVPELLEQAAELGLTVVGLSFHVGSQSVTAAAHAEAIDVCRPFFENQQAEGAGQLRILDIGGGLPVDYNRQELDLEEFCAPIRAALEAYPEGVQFIAEPGRVLSAPCIISISTIMGRAVRADLWWYYLDDGVYGAYSGQIFDHAFYPITVFSDHEETHPSVLAGPTCDVIDVISELAMLPTLEIGDLVVGEQMGAYTWVTACEFNSIPLPKLVVLNA